MEYGLSFRVTWICLLLFSTGSCFPATKADYRYPYTSLSAGGSAAGSILPSDGSRAPLVNLRYGPSVNNQQPATAPKQEASAPTGNQSPSSMGAHRVVVGSSPSYEPNRFSGSSQSGSSKPVSAPAVPSQGAGYVSPLKPAGTGSFPVSQSAGHFNLGSGGAASAPGYGASPAQAASRYMAPTLDFGDGPVPYIGDPAAFYSGAGASLNAKQNPGPAATGGLMDGPAPYYYGYGSHAAPETSSHGAGADSGLPWVAQPAEASFYDPSNWMQGGDFPDFSVFGSDANSKMSESEGETSPVPFPTYIIQSRNGYMRAQQVLSHTNYSPEEPEPQVFIAEPAREPRKTRPAAPKGGRKSY